jgi:hypothetical protein
MDANTKKNVAFLSKGIADDMETYKTLTGQEYQPPKKKMPGAKIMSSDEYNAKSANPAFARELSAFFSNGGTLGGNEMSRADFEVLDTSEQVRFIREGGELVD